MTSGVQSEPCCELSSAGNVLVFDRETSLLARAGLPLARLDELMVDAVGDAGADGGVGLVTARLRFGLLGPVRAWRDDQELDLGSPQQRAMLALLLLSDGKHVSVDDAAGALWGLDVPRGGGSTVRTYIYRLRRILTAVEGAGVSIQSDGGGYRLAIEPGALDVDAFRASLDAARDARGRGDLSEAARQLHGGLALWRGAPLAGVTGSFFDAQRVWLEQLRSMAFEERLAVDIELGNHAEAIAELTVGVTKEPYRERLWELLMLALYRSGRQADALSAYRDVGRLLSRELGLAPGPALRELHGRILAADPSLVESSAPAAPAAPAATVETLPKPAQLPPDVHDFVGRADEIVDMKDYLCSGEPSVVELTGLVDMGKSSLAVHVAHAIRSNFPDGQFYASLHTRDDGPVDPAEILTGFLRSLGVHDSRLDGTLSELTALWRTVLAERRVLIVLDDAYDSEQVFPLLPAAAGSVAIVTSLRPLIYIPGMRSIKVGPLTSEDALELFGKLVGEQRVSAERDAARRIVEACSCQPLAIRLAARWVLDRPARTMEQIEQHIREELRQPLTVSSDSTGAELRYRRAVARLPSALARMCRMFSVPDCAQLNAPIAAALLDLPLAQAARGLEALVSTHFMESNSDGTYYFHGFIKAIIRRGALREEGPAECKAALERLADYFLATMRNAASTIEAGYGTAELDVRGSTFPDRVTAQAWLSDWCDDVGLVLNQVEDCRNVDRNTRVAVDRTAHQHDLLRRIRVITSASIESDNVPAVAALENR
jgi:DNA-binding SARP family transcriptional activator